MSSNSVSNHTVLYSCTRDDKCPICLIPDSIEHTFLYRQESKEFFSKTLSDLMNIIKRAQNFQTSKFYLTLSMTPF